MIQNIIAFLRRTGKRPRRKPTAEIVSRPLPRTPDPKTRFYGTIVSQFEARGIPALRREEYFLKHLCEPLRLKRLWLLLLFPAGAFLAFFSARNPAFAESYANGFYSVWSLAWNRVSSLAPFSIAEFLVLLFLLFLLYRIVLFTVRMIRRRGRRARTALRFAANAACLVSVLFFLYMLNCGINYYRYTFADVCGLSIQPSSEQELKGLCVRLRDSVNRLRKEVPEDSDSTAKRNKNIPETLGEAKRFYDKMEAEYPTLRAGYGPPKSVLLSRAMSHLNITGIFFPFTFEANVNTDVPAYTIPATMCHELSHLRGYMREDEANFIGYLVCEKSGSAEFAYSGDMLAFVYASNALYAQDSDAANQIFAGLSDGVRRDLAANSRYWKQFEGPVSTASSRVNDRYLKANSQSDGVQSYGRMVDLLLAEQRAKQTA